MEDGLQHWSEHARSTLRRAGHRRGAARAAVVEVLARGDCCRSAREIASELEGGRVGLASVYRSLELLSELELVRRLDIGDGTTRYEPALPGGEHHHHLVCDRCGRVTAFEDDRLERAIAGLGERIGRPIEAHDVVLRGACAACVPSR